MRKVITASVIAAAFAVAGETGTMVKDDTTMQFGIGQIDNNAAIKLVHEEVRLREINFADITLEGMMTRIGGEASEGGYMNYYAEVLSSIAETPIIFGAGAGWLQQDVIAEDLVYDPMYPNDPYEAELKKIDETMDTFYVKPQLSTPNFGYGNIYGRAYVNYKHVFGGDAKGGNIGFGLEARYHIDPWIKDAVIIASYDLETVEFDSVGEQENGKMFLTLSKRF